MASAGTVLQLQDGVETTPSLLVFVRLELVHMASGTIRFIGGVRPGNHLAFLFMAVGAQRCHRMCAVVRRGMGVPNGRRPGGDGMASIARGASGDKMSTRLGRDVGIDPMARSAGTGQDTGMIEAAGKHPGGEGRMTAVTRGAGDGVGAGFGRGVFRIAAPMAEDAGARSSCDVAVIMTIQEATGNRMTLIARGRRRYVIGRLALGADAVTSVAGAWHDAGMIECAASSDHPGGE